jgi:hypothetical protein
VGLLKSSLFRRGICITISRSTPLARFHNHQPLPTKAAPAVGQARHRGLKAHASHTTSLEETRTTHAQQKA